jgi:serine-type D-Ala-D-Ala endopeptidase (penicillin-binding protein 7)
VHRIPHLLFQVVGLLFLSLAWDVGHTYAAAAKQQPQQRKTVSKAVAAAKAAPKSVQQVALRQGGKQRVGRRMAAPPPPEIFNPDVLDVQSTAALVINPSNGKVIYDKNIGAVAPIASITKLMTAMVVLDAKLPLNESIELTEDDLDTLKNTGSRLQIGTVLTRDEMLRLALMSSENRAASALGRAYPGGMAAFVREMNLKAVSLEMLHTSFVDSTGLSSSNVSTAQDLVKMVQAAYQYPLVRQYSTGNGYAVYANNGRPMQFGNSNSLVVSPDWHINLQKTGYIREAGRCLVMHTTIANAPIVIVLLDSWGRLSRVGDANRIKKWIEYHSGRIVG